MPTSPTYPGVYIDEVPSGVNAIHGVSTAITAFVGRTLRGELNQAIGVRSLAEYARLFGGLWEHSTVSYAVQDFFQNGGREAIIVRVAEHTSLSEFELPIGGTDSGAMLSLTASSPGAWGNNLRVVIDHGTADTADTNLFNLHVVEIGPRTGDEIISETFLNISTQPTSPRFAVTLIEQQSLLVKFSAGETFADGRPGASQLDDEGNPIPVKGSGGSDGNQISAETISGSNANTNDTGLYALRQTDLFNLLCIPPLELELFEQPDIAENNFYDVAVPAAAAFCATKRAMLIIDPSSNWLSANDAKNGVNAIRTIVSNSFTSNAVIYFPGLLKPDPLQNNTTQSFAPCGAIAGVFARTDQERGVWKAPAGINASLVGVRGLTVSLDEIESEELNRVAVNSIRAFPNRGNLIWGARTLAGADMLASDWKYLAVRRLSLFLEESLYRGTQWVVFEPNTESVWAQIRLSVGAFMQNLFRSGAFQGSSADDAFFVKCDSQTTTQSDIDQGKLNIRVGFAPLKPAEFIVIEIQQTIREPNP